MLSIFFFFVNVGGNKVARIMNSTEVQNPRHKLDDKCLCLSYVFGFVLVCAKSVHVFQKLSYSLCGLCLLLITLPQTVRLFYISLRYQAPQQQYIVHCMHYGITLWAYLSEPLVKESQTSKFDRKATIPHAQVS